MMLLAVLTHACKGNNNQQEPEKVPTDTEVKSYETTITGIFRIKDIVSREDEYYTTLVADTTYTLTNFVLQTKWPLGFDGVLIAPEDSIQVRGRVTRNSKDEHLLEVQELLWTNGDIQGLTPDSLKRVIAQVETCEDVAVDWFVKEIYNHIYMNHRFWILVLYYPQSNLYAYEFAPDNFYSQFPLMYDCHGNFIGSEFRDHGEPDIVQTIFTYHRTMYETE